MPLFTFGLPEKEASRIRRRCNSGELHCVIPGMYVPAAFWREAYLEQRVELCRQGYARAGRILVGRSAAKTWGMPLVTEPTVVEVAGARTRSLRSRYLQVRKVSIESCATMMGNTWLTTAAITCVDLARWNSLADSVLAADWSLRHGLITREDLEYACHTRASTAGISKANVMLRLASPASESPMESQLKVELFTMGFPPPELQAEIYSGMRFVGRVDFFYPHASVVIEYDGRAKLHDGNLEQNVERERGRERRLEGEGFTIIRVDRRSWKDGLWVDQLRRALENGRPYDNDRWRSAGPAWF